MAWYDIFGFLSHGRKKGNTSRPRTAAGTAARNSRNGKPTKRKVADVVVVSTKHDIPLINTGTGAVHRLPLSERRKYG